MKVTNEYQAVSHSFLFSFRSFTSLRMYVYIYTCHDQYSSFLSSPFTLTMTRTSSLRKANTTKMELKKLKSILPQLKQKPTSTPIEIVLETIRYIRQLEEQLIDQFQLDSTASIADLSSDSSASSIPLQDIGNSN